MIMQIIRIILNYANSMHKKGEKVTNKDAIEILNKYPIFNKPIYVSSKDIRFNTAREMAVKALFKCDKYDINSEELKRWILDHYKNDEVIPIKELLNYISDND